MHLKLIGPHPFARDEAGTQLTRIGTLFPNYGVLYTQTPGVHAWQRSQFIQQLNDERAAQGLPTLTLDEEIAVSTESTDLIFEPDHILIRPDPERMEMAFAADELLQELVSKRQVKFLSVSDDRVHEAIRRRGEYWRLNAIPRSSETKQNLVFASKVAISGLPIYFYNRLTGTRWLTYQSFEGLGQLNDAALAEHLAEIAEHAAQRNRRGRPELNFFAPELRRFDVRDFAGIPWRELPAPELRAKYGELKARFCSAVHETFRHDQCENRAWCQRMLSTLFLEGNEAQSEHILDGLSPEFFLNIDWLAGGRFDEGEFLLDSIFEEAALQPEDAELQRLCDLRAKGIIFNFIRDYGDLECINLGSLPESLSLDRPERRGRRGVFLAEFRVRSRTEPIKRFMRLQKWGVWDHLDAGKDLLEAILLSDEYTDYCLDRRVGCHQLGMNLSRRVVFRRLNQIYQGKNARYRGQLIRTTYFEREYVAGIATDKLPLERFSRPGYAARFARLLGQAAASSLIVGRQIDGGRTIFDDGDEVVIEGPDGLPTEILVTDHTGAFAEFKLPLETWAADYARPVYRRDNYLSDALEFAQVYLAALRDQFLRLQGDYRKRRNAFDHLFKESKYDPAGSFAYRWECVLRRLDDTSVPALVEAIRAKINVLNSGSARPAPEPKPALAPGSGSAGAPSPSSGLEGR